MKLCAVIAACVALTAPWLTAAAAQSAADEAAQMMVTGGAWQPGKFVPCADGSVTAVHPRLEEAGGNARPTFTSGVAVEIRLPSKPKFLNGQVFADARVVHYDHESGNAIMEKQRPGDRVQVCLVSFPTPTWDPQTKRLLCNPNIDPRGIVYRVFSYRQKAAYAGPDSQHSCGGA